MRSTNEKSNTWKILIFFLVKKGMATRIAFLNKTSAQECKLYSVYIQPILCLFFFFSLVQCHA